MELEGNDDEANKGIPHPPLGGFRHSFDCDLLRTGGGKCRQLADEKDVGRRSTAKMLTKDEARGIAVNVAKPYVARFVA